MSMHKIPLTPLEEAGLRAHGLDVGTPSQLSDVFRQGVKWTLEQGTPRATSPAQTEQQPLIYINPRVVDELEGKRKPSPGGLTWSRKACAHWTFPLYAAPIAQTAPKHPDDEAVDRFAVAMKAKLAASREKGRHGWQNAAAPHLSALLYDHLYKADPLDVGNLAMMLHQNGQAIELPQEARGRRQTTPQPEQEPFWYAVVSEQAPTINSAIKRLDVAQEFADSKRERWPDTRVVPLYTAQQPEQSGIDGEVAEKCDYCEGLTYGFPEAKWCCHCGAKLLGNYVSLRAALSAPAADGVAQ